MHGGLKDSIFHYLLSGFEIFKIGLSSTEYDPIYWNNNSHTVFKENHPTWYLVCYKYKTTQLWTFTAPSPVVQKLIFQLLLVGLDLYVQQKLKKKNLPLLMRILCPIYWGMFSCLRKEFLVTLSFANLKELLNYSTIDRYDDYTLIWIKSM